MELNIVLRRKKYVICFATTLQKECCCFFTFKKSWRIIAIWEHYPSTRNICQMLTGASKLFLLLIHSTWSLILNMWLLSITGEEEGADTFPQPKIFCSWMNQWNTLSRPSEVLTGCTATKLQPNRLILRSGSTCLAARILLKITKFLNLRIKVQIKSSINKWFKFRIFLEKKRRRPVRSGSTCLSNMYPFKKKRSKFRPLSMRRFLEKKKRLARWWRCWKL